MKRQYCLALMAFALVVFWGMVAMCVFEAHKPSVMTEYVCDEDIARAVRSGIVEDYGGER